MELCYETKRMVKYAPTSDAPRLGDIYISKLVLPKRIDGRYPQYINVSVEAVD
jgi:hypothetical protein